MDCDSSRYVFVVERLVVLFLILGVLDSYMAKKSTTLPRVLRYFPAR